MTEPITERAAQANPFPGLRPFDAKENHLFFGRDGQSDELLKRLRQNRFLAVVGTSGSGKSSLVRAGLLPSLYGGFMTRAGSNWRVAIFRPGNNPIGNLAQALYDPSVLGEKDDDELVNRTIIETTLRRTALGLVEAVRQARIPENENLLIVVDQFEEIFRFKETRKSEGADDEAAAFVKLLLEATAQEEIPIYIVITMRSDFLGDCAQFRDLPEAINDGQYLIPRMTRDQRRQAIAGPVAVGGATITPRLVNRLLNDVGDNPDQLPILQHALMRTWQYWLNERDCAAPIDLKHYEAIGGMAHALSRHADKAHDELTGERSPKIAEKLFKCLTDRGPDNRETRRPTKLSDICAVAEAEEDEVIAVIDRFRRQGRSFLMPPANAPLNGDTLIDISHESLIRGWERLRGWVDEEAESARIYRRLAETAALHKVKKAGLWHDPDLQLALLWRAQNKPNQAWAERYDPDFASAMAFLDKSKQKNEEEIAEVEKQRLKNLRRTQLFATVLGIAFLISLLAALMAYQQQEVARHQTKIAEQKTAEAEAALKRAKEQEQIAKQKTAEAEKAKEEALTQQKRAEDQTLIAEGKTAELEVSNRLAKKLAHQYRQAADSAIAARRVAENNQQISQQLALTARKSYLDKAQEIYRLTDSLIAISSPEEALRWKLVKASALSDLGKHDDAITESTQVLENEPDNMDALMQRGYMYIIAGKTRASVDDLEKVIKDNPRSSLGHLNIGISHGMLGDYEKAIDHINNSISCFSFGDYDTLLETKVSPDIINATKLKVLYINAISFRTALYYERATLLAAKGADFTEALKTADQQPPAKDAYLTALNWGWLHLSQRPGDYSVLASQAYLWARAGYPDQARQFYENFLDRYKQNPDVRYAGLARWVKQQLSQPPNAIDMSQWSKINELRIEAEESAVLGDHKNADAILTEAIRLSPQRFDLASIYQRALARLNYRNIEGASEDIDTLLKNAPDTTYGYVLRGFIRYSKADPAAEEDFRLALSKDPTNQWALLFLGRIMARNKRPEEAINLFQRYLKRQPFDSETLYTLAQLQKENKHYEEAFKTIQAAIAHNGNNPGLDYIKLYDERAEIEEHLHPGVQVMRNKADGYRDASQILLKRGKTQDAVSASVDGLMILTSPTKNGMNESLKCDVLAMMRNLSNILERGYSKSRAIAFWEGVIKDGDLKGYEPLVREEVARLTSSQ